MALISKQPYLFRGMYEWILDNHFTPYIVVNATAPEVQVPPKYIEDNKITLNLAPAAVTGFAMNNTALEFKASFGGRLLHIYIPMESIIAIYAKENNHCLVFGVPEITKGIIINMEETAEHGFEEDLVEEIKDPSTEHRPKGPPKLTIVKSSKDDN